MTWLKVNSQRQPDLEEECRNARDWNLDEQIHVPDVARLVEAVGLGSRYIR
jgi:hypothetical protein